MLLMQASHSKVFSHQEPVADPDPSSSAPLGVQKPASWTHMVTEGCKLWERMQTRGGSSILVRGFGKVLG